MPSKLLGPDFEDFTATSDNNRWLHSCRWEAALPETFLRARITLNTSLGKTPKHVKNKKGKESAKLAAQWLLVDENDQALAWAELQSFPRRYDKFGLLLWGSFISPLDERLSKALSVLIGLSFAVARFDRMKIVGHREVFGELSQSFGEVRELMTLNEKAWVPGREPLVRMDSWDFSMSEWQARKLNENDLTLKAVESRLNRHRRAFELGTKRKRRGFIARLFRPKIDDSFF